MIVGQRLNQGIYPVVIKHTEPKSVAYTRFCGLREVGRRIWQVRDWIRERGLERTGPPACIYYQPDQRPAVSLDDLVCEVQWDLAWTLEGSELPGNGVVKTRRMAPELVMSTFHQGDTDTIDESFELLRQALREEGYVEAGPRREIYLFDVQHPKSRWLTEIQIPIQNPVKESGRAPSLNQPAGSSSGFQGT